MLPFHAMKTAARRRAGMDGRNGMESGTSGPRPVPARAPVDEPNWEGNAQRKVTYMKYWVQVVV